MAKLSASQLQKLWVNAGGDPKVAPMMARIAIRESGGRSHINNAGLNKNGSIDYGLWQINSVHGYDPQKLYNPQFNAKAAVAVYKSQGPKAWSTYNAAIDKKYIGSAPKRSAYSPSSALGGTPAIGGTPDTTRQQLALSLLGNSYDSLDPLTLALQAYSQGTSQKTSVRPFAPPLQGPQPTQGDIHNVVARASAIDSEHLPYKWGGGHGARPAGPGVPVDCSGAVSRLLGVSPRVSGQFASYGKPGKGKALTIYANGHHVLLEIKGHFWGTSASNPGGGAGWIPRSQISQQYLKNFTARHPAGM